MAVLARCVAVSESSRGQGEGENGWNECVRWEGKKGLDPAPAQHNNCGARSGRRLVRGQVCSKGSESGPEVAFVHISDVDITWFTQFYPLNTYMARMHTDTFPVILFYFPQALRIMFALMCLASPAPESIVAS